MQTPVLPPPRKPGRWTWAVAGRLCGRTFVAVTLLSLVALVGWPEKHIVGFCGGGSGVPTRGKVQFTYFHHRDASLGVLVDAITE